jgi:hypothetical protein
MWTFQVHLSQYCMVIEDVVLRGIDLSDVNQVLMIDGIPIAWGIFVVSIGITLSIPKF